MDTIVEQSHSYIEFKAIKGGATHRNTLYA